MSPLGARAANAEAVVNRATPIVNMRLRPNRSPSAAPVSSRTANVSVYALTVHSSWDSDASRLCLMTGSAVVTTRLSSEVMNSASEVIAKVAIMSLRSGTPWAIAGYSFPLGGLLPATVAS